MGLKQKIRGSQGEKLAKCGIETTAKVQQKFRDSACKANFSLRIWDSQLKFMLQHPTVWFNRKQSKYPCKNCCCNFCTRSRLIDKQCLQTSVSIKLWKIFACHTGDLYEAKLLRYVPLSSWTLWKVSFWTVWKLKVAPYPIIFIYLFIYLLIQFV